MVALVNRRKAIIGAVASATAISSASKALAASQPTVHEVKMQRFRFDPDSFQIKLGDIIKWINEDLAPHTATADEFGWDTGELVKGASTEVAVVEGMEGSNVSSWRQ